MKLTFSSGAFELLDQKITDIQIALDKGLLNPETALRYIREARAELFLLRQILKNEVVIDNPGPDAPEAA